MADPARRRRQPPPAAARPRCTAAREINLVLRIVCHLPPRRWCRERARLSTVFEERHGRGQALYDVGDAVHRVRRRRARPASPRADGSATMSRPGSRP